jgi:hypothetical protein
MSAEAGAATVIFKWIWAPVVGLLGWFFKDKLTNLEATNRDLHAKVEALQKNLDKNYYDKNEIKESIVNPLQADMREIRSDLKAYSGMVTEIHQDMAILKFKILGEEFRKLD